PDIRAALRPGRTLRRGPIGIDGGVVCEHQCVDRVGGVGAALFHLGFLNTPLPWCWRNTLHGPLFGACAPNPAWPNVAYSPNTTVTAALTNNASLRKRPMCLAFLSRG